MKAKSLFFKLVVVVVLIALGRSIIRSPIFAGGGSGLGNFNSPTEIEKSLYESKYSNFGIGFPSYKYKPAISVVKSGISWVELGLSSAFSILLVFAVEWGRMSGMRFVKVDPLIHDNGHIKRKFLKIGVRIEGRRLGGLLPPYVHNQATMTAAISNHKKSKYHVKWDFAPEPISYPHGINQTVNVKGEYGNKVKKLVEFKGAIDGVDNGYARVDMLPLALQSENLLPEDKAEASFLVKHDGEPGFYIYDPEYYFDPSPAGKNYCDCKKVYIKLTFRFSLLGKESYYSISNPGTKLEKFVMKEITKEKYLGARS